MENKKEENKKGPVCPEAIVGGLIVDGNGEIVLGKSKKWTGQYTIFGGHVEVGETMEEAVRREVKEEAGIDVEVVDKIGFLESIFDPGFNAKKHFIFLDFLCLYQGDKNALKLNEEFEDEYIWISPEKALEMDIPAGTKRIIEEYLEYKERKNSLDGWKRCQADFENYKKRQAEERKNLLQYGNADLILEILPVVDNFHASTDHIPENEKDSPWVVGIMHIQKQLEKVLEDNNVTEIKIKAGDKFDPEIMEAIADANLPASPAGGRTEYESTNEKIKEKSRECIVKKIVQKGYKINERVIRAARVVVE